MQQLADRTLPELEALGDHMQYTKALCWSGDNLARNGHPEEGKTRILEAVSLARKHSLGSFLPIALGDAAEAAYRCGDDDEAEGYARECILIAREKGIRYVEMRGLNYLWRVTSRRGDMVTAQGYIDECLRKAAEVRDYFGVTAALLSQADIHIRQGNLTDAAERLRQVV